MTTNVYLGTEVKNDWSCTSASPMCCLGMDKDNFTFFLPVCICIGKFFKFKKKWEMCIDNISQCTCLGTLSLRLIRHKTNILWTVSGKCSS